VAKALDDVTVIYVTHRPSTLEYVDRVLMLEAGEIVGFDTHTALQSDNAQYRTLFNLYQHEQKEAEKEQGAA
jgi:ABC-type multidrug transport system fused ATPase/permease subunit